jgi:hypothetical protein
VYQAELEGVDAKAIQPLREALSKSQQNAQQFQLDAIKNANEANAKSGASFTEAIKNLMDTAAASGLNMDEKGFQQAATAMQGMTPEQQETYLANFGEQEQLLLRGLTKATPYELS